MMRGGCSLKLMLATTIAGLYGNQAPSTVRNFLELVKQGSYNSTLFNKVHLSLPECLFPELFPLPMRSIPSPIADLYIVA